MRLPEIPAVFLQGGTLKIMQSAQVITVDGQDVREFLRRVKMMAAALELQLAKDWEAEQPTPVETPKGKRRGDE
jgi:hypothetical protein